MISLFLIWYLDRDANSYTIIKLLSRKFQILNYDTIFLELINERLVVRSGHNNMYYYKLSEKGRLFLGMQSDNLEVHLRDVFLKEDPEYIEQTIRVLKLIKK